MKRRDWLKLSSITGLAFFTPKVNGQINDDQNEVCDISTKDIQGPFFTPNAPVRNIIIPKNAKGTHFFLTGTVYHNDCETPISYADIEVWQADHSGEYDNEGFNYRGQIKTDELGNFSLETILPGKYLNGSQYRPRHIHFKFKSKDSKELTTQLYFEGDNSIPKDPWASDLSAKDRIIPLSLDMDSRLHGVFDVKLNIPPTKKEKLSFKNARILNIENPINYQGNLNFYLPNNEDTTIEIYDINSMKVKTLTLGILESGQHNLVLNKLSDDGINLTPSIYILQLKTNKQIQDSKRFTII